MIFPRSTRMQSIRQIGDYGKLPSTKNTILSSLIIPGLSSLLLPMPISSILDGHLISRMSHLLVIKLDLLLRDILSAMEWTMKKPMPQSSNQRLCVSYSQLWWLVDEGFGDNEMFCWFGCEHGWIRGYICISETLS